MGIFGERIKDTEAYDNHLFDSAVSELKGAVSENAFDKGTADLGSAVQIAVERILCFYRIKPRWQKKKALAFEELIDYQLKPYDLIKRYVDVKSDWCANCSSPMLGVLEDGGITALLPFVKRGYRYTDPKTGKSIRLKSTEDAPAFKELIAVYRALPARPISKLDLSGFILKNLNRKDLLIFFITTFLFVLLGIFLPSLGRQIANEGLIESTDDIIAALVLIVLPILFIRLAFGFSKERLLHRIGLKISGNLQAALMGRIYSLPVGEVNKYNAGNVAQHIMQIEIVTSKLITSGLSLIVSAVFSCIYLSIAVDTAPSLITPSMRVVIAIMVLNLVSAFFQYRLSLESFRFKGIEAGMTYSLIRGMKKINLSGAKKRAFAKWAETYKRSAEIRYKPPIIVRVAQPLTVGLTAFGMLELYAAAYTSSTAPADFYGFTIAFSLTAAAFIEAAAQIGELAVALPIFNLIKPILDAHPEASVNRTLVERLDGRVSLNKVSFAYEGSDRKILDNVSFSIKRNEYVALVGKSGCGKSTLVKLILGFENPQTGDVFYNSQPLKTMDLRSLRANIGVVLQNGTTVKGSIEDNIKLNNRNASPDDVWEAVRTAGLESDVLAMPLGLKTPLPLGGKGVSGGQVQKILIARAIVSKPRILILDEATSALDNISQKQISDALDALKCTRIVIAHRLSTIKNCDRILVLNEGSIVEEGSFDELINKHGFFAELVKNQMLDE